MKNLIAVSILLLATFLITDFSCFAANNLNDDCCGKNGGDQRIVNNPDQVKKNEASISWKQVRPQGSQEPQGAKGDTSSRAQGGIKVYDAKKQFLGYLLDPWGVYVPQLEVIVEFILCCNNYAVGDIAWDFVYFESNDCSGDPYTMPHNANIIFKYQNKIFTGEKTSPVLKSRHSMHSLTSTGSSYCSSLSRTTDFLIPAKEFTSKLPFGIPVSFPLEMKSDD